MTKYGLLVLGDAVNTTGSGSGGGSGGGTGVSHIECSPVSPHKYNMTHLSLGMMDNAVLRIIMRFLPLNAWVTILPTVCKGTWSAEYRMPRRRWATQSGENYETGSGCGRGSNIAKLFLQKQYHWGQSEHEMKKIPICGDKKLWSEFVDDTIYWGKLPQQDVVQKNGNDVDAHVEKEKN